MRQCHGERGRSAVVRNLGQGTEKSQVFGHGASPSFGQRIAVGHQRDPVCRRQRGHGRSQACTRRSFVVDAVVATATCIHHQRQRLAARQRHRLFRPFHQHGLGLAATRQAQWNLPWAAGQSFGQ